MNKTKKSKNYYITIIKYPYNEYLQANYNYNKNRIIE